ncbi:MAG: hypothetical protein ABJC10_12985 [Acidobacteriota bacterium]
MKEINARDCGRESDLIGFLYGELGEGDTLGFQRHLRECSACSTELAGFANVRESVVAWRNESLGSLALPNQIAAASSGGAPSQKPSAVAALREFFNLSPLWMKGALAFAALLLCVLGGLAVARLRDEPKSVVVAAPVPAASSQEIKALVDQRVQEELNRLKKSREEAAPISLAIMSQPKPFKRIANRSTEVAGARRPLTETEREQLAADLRLVASKTDSLDLLDDTINQ